MERYDIRRADLPPAIQAAHAAMQQARDESTKAYHKARWEVVRPLVENYLGVEALAEIIATRSIPVGTKAFMDMNGLEFEIQLRERDDRMGRDERIVVFQFGKEIDSAEIPGFGV